MCALASFRIPIRAIGLPGYKSKTSWMRTSEAHRAAGKFSRVFNVSSMAFAADGTSLASISGFPVIVGMGTHLIR